MALRLGALHDALLHPGDVALAQKAAEEVAGYESRLASIDGQLRLLTWMTGTNTAITLAILWRVFS